MIQRIQTIWLLLATITCAALFSLTLYSGQKTGADGVPYPAEIKVLGNNLPLLIVGVLITLLPLIAVFLFRNRKQQQGVTIMGILADIGFISLVLMEKNKFDAAGGNYHIWMVLPVISILFLVLALRGIRKDEKLVRSLDRLR